MTDDYWTDFVRESEDHITELNNALLVLERTPEDETAIDGIFRIVHTLKGNCGAMGLTRASDLAHALEDLLDGVRAGSVGVSSELMDTVFDGVDELEAMLGEVEDGGGIERDPTATIEAIRTQLEAATEDDRRRCPTPTDDEIDAVLARFEPPANADHDAYFVRFAVADAPDGRRIVDALIDAFELIGTDPSLEAIENETFGSRFDAVFASAVGEAAIAAALEPVDAVDAVEIVTVTGRFDAAASTAPAEAISTEDAQELAVDDLLEEFEEFDDLDAMVEDTEDDDLDVFDEMGDAGSFDDLLGDEREQIAAGPAAADTDEDARPTAADDPEDKEAVEGDANDVFAALKDEVEMVGFDELQSELDELEFDEFDSEDEVGMDELLGDDFDDDDSFLDVGEESAVRSVADDEDRPDETTEAVETTDTGVFDSDTVTADVTFTEDDSSVDLTVEASEADAETVDADVAISYEEDGAAADGADDDPVEGANDERVHETGELDREEGNEDGHRREGEDENSDREPALELEDDSAGTEEFEDGFSVTADEFAGGFGSGTVDEFDDGFGADADESFENDPAAGFDTVADSGFEADFSPGVDADADTTFVDEETDTTAFEDEDAVTFTNEDTAFESLEGAADDLEFESSASVVDEGFDDVTDGADASSLGIGVDDDVHFEEPQGDDRSSSPDRVVDETAPMTIPDLVVPEPSERAAADHETDQGSIRVDVEQIDSLLTLVEGLVTSRVRLRHAIDTGANRQTVARELDDLEGLTADLQETVMDVRLVPLETVANRLPRVVRDIAREQEKEVTFDLSGGDVELDRSILDRIGDPLIHLVRNAVDHGIEPAADRERAEKPQEGRIEVRASRARDRVRIVVEDDGRGLDPNRLREAALEADVLTDDEAAALTDDDAYDLIFHPGLSTADSVTDVSGRGVGMDVVERTIERLEGTVSVDSDPGAGTTVTMTLPVTVAIADVLFLEAGGEEFGLPVKAVQDIETASAIETVDGRDVLPTEDAELPVVDLADALDTPVEGSTDGGMVIRIRDAVRPAAIRCDTVSGQQEVVVKPFEGFMGDIPGLSGATVRGRGKVVTILDVTTL